MRRYEQVIQDACSGVEMSCVSCGEFGSGLAAVDEDHLRSMEMKIGVRIQLDHCGIVDGSYQFCQPCLNALDGGRIPKFSANQVLDSDREKDVEGHLMIIDSDIAGIVEFHLYILVSSVYIRVRSTLTKISKYLLLFNQT
jgi:hypothetical protein